MSAQTSSVNLNATFSIVSGPWQRDFILDPDDPDLENTLDLAQNDIIMVRYRFIKALLEEDAVELI